jgi:hypothetical protein
VANELTLSFVPAVEQRLWRTVMRTENQLRCNQVQVQNRLETPMDRGRLPVPLGKNCGGDREGPLRQELPWRNYGSSFRTIC